MRIESRICLGVALVGMVMAPARAAEGRIPIFQPSTVITEQGSYYVTQNLIGTGAAPVIRVAVSSVDVDLNGFTLSGGVGPAAVIVIDAVDNVRIHGGVLTGGGRSIDVPVAGLFYTIEDISASASSGAGIRWANGGGLLIRRVQILHAGAEGILLENGEQATVEDSLVSGNFASAAIRLSNLNASQVLRCTIRHPAAEGILVDGGAGGASLGVQLRDNMLFDSIGDAIRMDTVQGGEIWNNAVHRSIANGIHIMSTAREISVRENHVNNCSLTGLLIEGVQNSATGNHVTNNFDWGFRLTSTAQRNTFGGNSISGNQAFTACTGTAMLNDFCNAGVNNASFGNNLVPSVPLF